MKQQAFIDRHSKRWNELEQWFKAEAKSEKSTTTTTAGREFPQRYRELCQHLGLARDRFYGADLTERLNRLMHTGHQRLYGGQTSVAAQFGGMMDFILRDFPAAVRAQSLVVWIGMALLFIPLLAMIAVLQYFPDFATYLASPEQLRDYERMYRPGARLGARRDADSQVMMFGFYIWNNVKIDFQCFAGGIAFGLGSIFFLVYNGIMIGTVAGYLTQLGYISTFWGFVAGHSSFELVGAAFSGAAGLKMGYALIAPGRLTRMAALKRESAVAVQLLIGAAGMTVIAAFIEAFWSSNGWIAPTVKYAVGLSLWALLGAYFLFVGRERATD